MDIRLLRCFVEVARRGSVTAAARELGMSQPTLSRQVRRLEGELGLKLLERRADGVALTSAGRKALAGARSTVRSFDAMCEALLATRDEPPLRLGMPPSAIRLLLDELMQRMHPPGQPVRLSVTEGTNASLLEGVRSGQLEVVIATDPPLGPQFRSVTLWTEQLFLVRSASFGALPSTASLRDAAALPLILGRASDTIRQSIESALTGQGLRPQVVMELEGIASVKRVLEKQPVATFAPWVSVRDEVAEGRLVCSAVEDLWIRRCAITTPGTAAEPRVRALLRVLSDLPRQLLHGESWARLPHGSAARDAPTPRPAPSVPSALPRRS